MGQYTDTIQYWPRFFQEGSNDQTREEFFEAFTPAIYFDVFAKNIEKTPKEQTRGVTIGSWFAVNIINYLRSIGMDFRNIRREENANLIHANLKMLSMTVENENLSDDKKIKSYSEIYKSIENSNIIIITAGVLMIPVNVDTGEYFDGENLRQNILDGKAELRLLSASENLADFEKLYGLFRKINTTAQIIVTLSPHIPPELKFTPFAEDDGSTRHPSRWLIDQNFKLFEFVLFTRSDEEDETEDAFH